MVLSLLFLALVVELLKLLLAGFGFSGILLITTDFPS
jgi:hypothetical protein